VYNPQSYFQRTLESVLAQDPGPDVMQITVVDDASSVVSVEPFVRAVAGNRIGYIRQPRNTGLARNWNTCVAHSAGTYVHILHQDDLVEPGFYTALAVGFATDSSVGMAFCRHKCIDENDQQLWVSGIERPTIQCPSVVVRRDVYAAVGGFRHDLRYLLDWEMWIRIAARYSVWYEPRILATYRRHPASETDLLLKLGLIDDDYQCMFTIMRSHLPFVPGDRLIHESRDTRGRQVIDEAIREFEAGRFRAGLSRALVVNRVSHNPAVTRAMVARLLRTVRNMISRLVRRLVIPIIPGKNNLHAAR
jgi:glycosyltransferase involved in cell wall biosynthesis